MQVEVVGRALLVIAMPAARSTAAAAVAARCGGLVVVLMVALMAVTRRLLLLVARILAEILPSVLARAMNLAFLAFGTMRIRLPALVLLFVIPATTTAVVSRATVVVTTVGLVAIAGGLASLAFTAIVVAGLACGATITIG